MTALRIGVLGDLHGAFDDTDVEQLDAQGYDVLVVVGDLAGFRFSKTLAIARVLAKLTTPTLVVPGNHDASHPVQQLAEALRKPAFGHPFASTQSRNLTALEEALGAATLSAYSSHRFGDVTLIAGRPHSMGGPDLAFAPHLRAGWGVDSLDASTERLIALVDDAPTNDLLFIAHNGPTGLGDTADAIWGCDFRREAGDWGDPDLARAIQHAQQRGRRVLAVLAGHMHRRIRGGGRRQPQCVRDGTLYVNAAEVPRRRDGRRHHVELVLSDPPVATDRWLEVPT